MQYEQTPSSIPIALQLLLLFFFLQRSGRGLVEEKYFKAISGQAHGLHNRSLLFWHREVQGSSVTQRSSCRLQKCRALRNELEKVETGELSVDRVDNAIPSSLHLLAALLPSPDTHQRQEYYKWKCFLLFFGRILSIAPVFF